MIILASTSDLVRLITGAAVNIDVHASYVDLNGSTVTPGRQNTLITTATTTTVVSSPGASTVRTVKTLSVRNRSTSTSCDVTVFHTDGTNAPELFKVTLYAGENLCYHEAAGFWIVDRFGQTKNVAINNGVNAAINTLNTVVLASDVTNNNGVANTIADITGLSFSVTAAETYWFRFIIDYTAAATTTGGRFSINGPGAPTRLAYWTRYSISATLGTDADNSSTQTAYDTPAGAGASSATTGGNIAVIEGFITPSANGTVIARFASEVASSAIVAKAGSLLQWLRTL